MVASLVFVLTLYFSKLLLSLVQTIKVTMYYLENHKKQSDKGTMDWKIFDATVNKLITITSEHMDVVSSCLYSPTQIHMVRSTCVCRLPPSLSGCVGKPCSHTGCRVCCT